MASAVASPSLFYQNNSPTTPKSGILLNPYPPARSPRMIQAQSLPLPSSERPAFCHSAPNSPYMAINTTNVPLPRPGSRSSSGSQGDSPDADPGGPQGGGHSRANSMRIRFAPLPDIRKMEEADYVDSPLVATQSALSATENDRLDASPTTPGSQYSQMSANSNGSTNGTLIPFVSNTAYDPTEATSDVASLSSATKQKSKNWTKRIFRPLLKSTSLASSSSNGNGHQSDDGLWRTNSRDSFTSATSNEGGGHPLSRRMTTDSSFPAANTGASGPPLTRVQSAGVGPGRNRKTTKMLNGRVYGSKSTASAFQNIREGEPTFVEWGHGGAGSVNNHSGGADGSKYSSIQSGDKVSIGAVSGDGSEMGGDDYDDGSGVAWLRKRKQQRERERLENEAKALQDAKDAQAATMTNSDIEKTSTSNVGPESHQLITEMATATEAIPRPDDAREEEGGRALPERSPQAIEPVSPRQGFPVLAGNTVVSPSASGTHTPAALGGGGEEHHIVKAIKVPAPPHVHVHGHAHGLDGSNNATLEAVTKPGEPSEIGTGAPSSKSSTDSDSEEEEDDDEREEEESETDEEDTAENEQRKTSVCAGVEKISRHKELEQQ